jgi:hypothetical protein
LPLFRGGRLRRQLNRKLGRARAFISAVFGLDNPMPFRVVGSPFQLDSPGWSHLPGNFACLSMKNSKSWLATVLLLLSLISAEPRNAPAPAGTGDATHSKALKAAASMPLCFQASGQLDNPPATYLARGRGYAVQLSPTEALISLTSAGGMLGGANANLAKLGRANIRTATLRLQLLEADPRAGITAAEPLSVRVNDFTGGDPARWRGNIPTYGRVSHAPSIRVLMSFITARNSSWNTISSWRPRLTPARSASGSTGLSGS